VLRQLLGGLVKGGAGKRPEAAAGLGAPEAAGSPAAASLLRDKLNKKAVT